MDLDPQTLASANPRLAQTGYQKIPDWLACLADLLLAG